MMKITAKDGRPYFLEPIGSMDRISWANQYTKWINNKEVTKFLYQGTIPTSIDKCMKLYDAFTDENHVVFNIHTDDSYPIGIVGIFEIYWPSRVGEFRIILGETAHWGKGLGKLCLEEMNHIAFDRLNLHKFWLGFNANHKRAEKAYTKSGFKHECILKQHHYKNGTYNDLIRMCMFREDYKAWLKSKQD